MTREQLDKIMEYRSKLDKFRGRDTAVLGLNLIVRYLPSSGVMSAEHDIIYSASVDDLLKAGLTEEDARELRYMNWMIKEDHLACFV